MYIYYIYILYIYIYIYIYIYLYIYVCVYICNGYNYVLLCSKKIHLNINNHSIAECIVASVAVYLTQISKLILVYPATVILSRKRNILQSICHLI